MFLQAPPDTPATAGFFRDDVDELGYVMNASRLWARRLDVAEAFSGLRALLIGGSSLSPREVGVLVCATVAGLGDSYCSLAWGQRLALATDEPTAAAVLRGSAHEAMTVRERALAQWARKVAKDPNATTLDDVESLRAAGLSDQEIFEATTLIAFRLAFSTVNDALGAQPDWQLAAGAPPLVRDAVTFGRPCAART